MVVVWYVGMACQNWMHRGWERLMIAPHVAVHPMLVRSRLHIIILPVTIRTCAYAGCFDGLGSGDSGLAHDDPPAGGCARSRSGCRRGAGARRLVVSGRPSHLRIHPMRPQPRPRTWCFKIADPDLERMMPQRNVREVQFYRVVAPLVGDLPIVHCYDAAYQRAEVDRFHLLLANPSATTHQSYRYSAVPPTRAVREDRRCPGAGPRRVLGRPACPGRGRQVSGRRVSYGVGDRGPRSLDR